jgi:hypothetical protein
LAVPSSAENCRSKKLDLPTPRFGFQGSSGLAEASHKTRMKIPLVVIFLACNLAARAAEPETLTLRLTRLFDELWERGDAAGMYAFLDPDCVYKTPFRTEIGRDQIRDHVFRNFSRFRNAVSTEEFSKIEKNFAYSIGATTFDEVDPTGAIKAKWVSRYLHIFTRRPGEDWRLRFHVVHEDAAHASISGKNDASVEAPEPPPEPVVPPP